MKKTLGILTLILAINTMANTQIDAKALAEIQGNKCQVSQTGIYGQTYIPYQDVLTEETSEPIYLNDSEVVAYYQDELFNENNYSYRVSVRSNTFRINVYHDQELVLSASSKSQSPLNIVHNYIVITCNSDYLERKFKQSVFKKLVSTITGEDKKTERVVYPKRKEGAQEVYRNSLTGPQEIQNFLQNHPHLISKLNSYILTHDKNTVVTRVERKIYDNFYLGQKYGCIEVTKAFNESDEEILSDTLNYDHNGSCF